LNHIPKTPFVFRRFVTVLPFIFLVLGCSILKADSQKYPPELVKKINRCKAIPKNEIQKDGIGIIPGVPSYYLRSQCFFKLAIAERRPDLCNQVTRLFSSKYTSGNCRKIVQEKIAEDKAFAGQLSGVYHHIDKAFVALNNNGKDYDFIIKVTGDKRVSYKMEWTIGSHLLYAEVRTFFKETSQVHLFVTKQELIQRLDVLPFDQTHRLKVTLTKKIDRFRNKFLSENDKTIETYIDVDFSKVPRYRGD
jgi:hypothetical protein